VRAGRQQREEPPVLSDPLDVLASSIRTVSELVPEEPERRDSGGEITAKRGA